MVGEVAMKGGCLLVEAKSICAVSEIALWMGIEWLFWSTVVVYVCQIAAPSGGHL